MDEAQFGFDAGPCLWAARRLETIYIADFRSDERFPKYHAAIVDHGIRSALGVPVDVEGDANSGIDFCCREPDAFTHDAIAEAQKFADEVSKSLRLSVKVARLSETRCSLQAALESRATINLPAGEMMAQNRCSQDEATNLLEAASNARNIKLHAVAAAVLESVGSRLARRSLAPISTFSYPGGCIMTRLCPTITPALKDAKKRHAAGTPRRGQTRLRTARSIHMTAPMMSTMIPIHSRNTAAFTAMPKMRRTIPTMISVKTSPMARCYSKILVTTQLV